MVDVTSTTRGTTTASPPHPSHCATHPPLSTTRTFDGDAVLVGVDVKEPVAVCDAVAVVVEVPVYELVPVEEIVVVDVPDLVYGTEWLRRKKRGAVRAMKKGTAANRVGS